MKANEYIARFLRIIDDLDNSNVKIPGLILSHAGFGKTSTVQMYCDYMDYNLITLIPSMYSSDDILGLQSVQGGKLNRLTPSWFNKMKEILKNGKRTILFIDEITTCDPYIQGPLLDLIFNGNLGEEHLPENVFIVAAGNYSDDLNNVFKMSAPLVNRFVILNLRSEDFSIEELLDRRFEKVKEKKDIESFLGLPFNKKPTYDYQEFTKWITDQGEIIFGSTNYIEDESFGLLGFTSVRSLDNSLKFAEKYINSYNDTLWVRIIGDTLGMSNRRPDKPLSLIISSFTNLFKKRNTSTSNSSQDKFNPPVDFLKKISKSIASRGVTPSIISSLEEFIDNMEAASIDSDSLELLSTILSSNANKDIWNLRDKLSEKVTSWFC